MVFSSATFLLAFLPITLMLYFLVPTRPAKNVILLIVSLVFYAWGEPTYIVLMVASIIVNWISAILIEKSRARRKLLLVINLVINLGILGFFKYESFLADNVNALLGSSLVPNLELPLPIGISFYTLQAVSYVIDVYRKEVPAQHNPLYLGMYIACFPQLVAGPIVRYETIQDQVLHRKETLDGFSQGMRLFIVGLGKKVLLANVVAILAAKMLSLGGASIGIVGAWGGLLAFTFQIYFDFAGYSDMAIGLGKMFGFSYLRNFNYPYIATSATEFWRRWHISLSSFFRDYVYIPLGGNRVSKARWMFNILVVWCLTGFWHGAAWNYVLWGLFYGVLLLLEKNFLLRFIDKLPSILRHLYGILTFMFGWLLFWIEDMSQMGPYLAAMFGSFGLTGASTAWELTVWEYIPVFVVCCVASTPIVPWLRAHLIAWAQGSTVHDFLRSDLPAPKCYSTDSLCRFDTRELSTTSDGRKAILGFVGFLIDLVLVVLLALSIMSVVTGSFNPFIYFRF